MIPYWDIQMPLAFLCTKNKWHQLAQGLNKKQSPIPSSIILAHLYPLVSCMNPRNHTLSVPFLLENSQGYIGSGLRHSWQNSSPSEHNIRSWSDRSVGTLVSCILFCAGHGLQPTGYGWSS